MLKTFLTPAFILPHRLLKLSIKRYTDVIIIIIIGIIVVVIALSS